MMRTIPRIVAFFAMLGLALPALAEPHPFEAPPILPGQANVVQLQAMATPPSVGCTPQGQMSRDGSIVSVVLDLVRAKFFINNPDPSDPQPKHLDPVELRSYGGCKSGPAITVKPGDTLRVDLINRLDKDDPSCLDNPPSGLSLPAGVGCFNTTNLHLHGLHVSPAGNSDNVLLSIAPQTKFPYEINLPADHPSGTFWYHAHRHGSTATQVASGTSGVLIVKGDRRYTPPTAQTPHPIADIDTVLHGPNNVPFKEQLFLFQQIAYACYQNLPNQQGGPWQQLYTTQGLYNVNSQGAVTTAPWTCPLSTDSAPVSAGVIENFSLQLDSASIWDTNGRFTSINGVVQPDITLPAGEIQRWRFVHAGIHDTINVQVVRATPVGGKNLIATSALSGNRQQQKQDLLASCNASPATLVPQFEIATDGLTRVKLHTIHSSQVGGVLESNYMQPGYRSDILLAFPSDGDYCLLNQAAPPSERVSNGGASGGGQGPSTPQLLAYVHVRGGHAVTGDLQAYVAKTLYDGNPQLPAPVRTGLRDGDLRPWAPFISVPPPRVGGEQTADFAINFPAFTINNKSYDPNVVNYTREVNTTDDWLLTAKGEPHIFHIHVNPFQVMDVQMINSAGQLVSIYNPDGTCKPGVVSGDGQQLANQYCGMWHTFRDTIIVENNFQVRVRTHYERYIGEYVIHCHILDHEDSGMMANISIVPDLNAPGGGIGMAGMMHRHATPVAATPAPAPPAATAPAPATPAPAAPAPTKQ
jgi:FtsP/CotA-like multicopper oxidase with cupredoxin domain